MRVVSQLLDPCRRYILPRRTVCHSRGLVDAVVGEPHEAPRADNPEATRDRACGCLLGLAIAEALLTEAGNQGAQQQQGRIRRHVWGSATALCERFGQDEVMVRVIRATLV